VVFAVLLSKLTTLFTSPYSGRLCGGADGIQDTSKASPQVGVQV